VASAVASSAGWSVRELTITERNWCLALALTIASNVLFWVFVRMEELAGYNWSHYRVVLAPSETSMRFFAQAHYLVAFLYMITSSRMRRLSAWATLFGLAIVAAFLCAGFRKIGGIEAPLGAILFYVYFLAHDFRDQVVFYQANGDLPAGEDARQANRDILGAPALAFAFLTAFFVFGGAFEIGGAARYAKPFAHFPDALSYAIGIGTVLAAVVLGVALKSHYDRRYENGTAGFLAQHRPIFFVFAGMIVALFAGLQLTGRGYAIISLHVMGWYVFYYRVLGWRPRSGNGPSLLSWKWMRTTPAGFTFVHVAVVVMIVLTAAYWAYFGNNSKWRHPGLYVFLSRDAFAYWTILHITLSFLPGRELTTLRSPISGSTLPSR